MKEIFASMKDISIGSLSLSTLLSAVMVLIICCAAIRIAMKLLITAMGRTRLDPAIKGFVCTVTRVLLWALAIIITADSLGIPTTSLVAVLSVAGLALSLSVQNIMTNLFSGITLLITHPFGAGDFVSVGSNQGTVKSVGLFYTVMDTPDNKTVSVPNGDITASSVTNFSREATRRVDMTFSASYDSSTESVHRAIMDAIGQDDRILPDPAPFTAISSYGDSSITYAVRVWCANADYWDVYFALNERVRECFEKYGVLMSYNHLNVHMVTDGAKQAIHD
ncbi:MAG: mechanosensitive ion channel family protein [Butyricicoccus sp.]|nr:mechanosensitive ion channel family protein [Butyricicoccus sp.]